MKYEAITSVEDEFVRITAKGDYAFDELFGFIEYVGAESERTGRDRVLIDCGKLAGGMTEVERFEGGQKIAEVFATRIKAALIIPQPFITKLGEVAAVNRGARFFVTSSESEALEWLLAN
jgi:hypothetical protein